MKKPLQLSALVALSSAAWMLTACSKQAAAPAPQPPQVHTVTVKGGSVPADYTAIGRIVTAASVNLVARVTGTLLEKPFSDGSLVKKGDVLYRIDPSEFQANLDSASAKLAQSEAKLAKALSDLKRTENLLKAGGMSQQEYDDANTNVLASKADVQAAAAAASNARLQLSYTTITAPISGRIGATIGDVGGLLSPSMGTLATVDQIDPIQVEFTVGEERILNMNRELKAGLITSTGVDSFVVTATLLNGMVHEGSGLINFADIRYRSDTGTILAKAQFPNPNGFLKPGQFARISISGVSRNNAITIPQTAVIQGPTGSQVYVVNAEGSAEARQVVPGEWVGSNWRIISGLKDGDQVITDKLQKLRSGIKVQVVDTK